MTGPREAQTPTLIADILTRASRIARIGVHDSDQVTFTPLTTLGDVDRIAIKSGLGHDRLLAAAALAAFRDLGDAEKRGSRNKIEFLVADRRNPETLVYTQASSTKWSLVPTTVLEAVGAANLALELIHDLANANEVPIFKLLGLRNLSSFVGEVFANELYKIQKDRFIGNPNQDGYPDLLALVPEGVKYIKEREQKGEMSAKNFWSPYRFGGIEIKATCGDTPPARHTPKPRIGESRLPTLNNATWKAHHRETNNLLGIFWDFVEGLPTVVATFYRNDLTTNDWGKIVSPKEGGGRTTSVSIMTRDGMKKMGQGWIVLPKRPDMLAPLCQARVFNLSLR